MIKSGFPVFQIWLITLDHYTPSSKHRVNRQKCVWNFGPSGHSWPIHTTWMQLSRHWLAGDCLYFSCRLSSAVFIILGNLLFEMHVCIRLVRGTDYAQWASLSNLPGIPSYPVSFLMFKALSFRWIISGLISLNINGFALSANLPLIFITLGWFLCFDIELVVDIILSAIIDAILEKIIKDLKKLFIIECGLVILLKEYVISISGWFVTHKWGILSSKKICLAWSNF